jgi:hypothetical protein
VGAATLQVAAGNANDHKNVTRSACKEARGLQQQQQQQHSLPLRRGRGRVLMMWVAACRALLAMCKSGVVGELLSLLAGMRLSSMLLLCTQHVQYASVVGGGGQVKL